MFIDSRVSPYFPSNESNWRKAHAYMTHPHAPYRDSRAIESMPLSSSTYFTYVLVIHSPHWSNGEIYWFTGGTLIAPKT